MHAPRHLQPDPGVLTMKRLAIIGAAGLVLAACGWHGTGTVVQKDYDRAWTQVTVQCHPIGTKGQTVCVPTTIYHSEQFRLKVRAEADSKTHWVGVDQHEYDSAKIGDAFSNGSSR